MLLCGVYGKLDSYFIKLYVQHIYFWYAYYFPPKAPVSLDKIPIGIIYQAIVSSLLVINTE